MFFFKKELKNNLKIIILTAVILSFIIAISIALFSLSKALIKSHEEFLNGEHPKGDTFFVEYQDFNAISETSTHKDISFYSSNNKSIVFLINGETKVSEYMEVVEGGDINYYSYSYGEVIMTDGEMPKELSDIKYVDIKESLYPLIISNKLALYLNAKVGDEISISQYFIDENDHIVVSDYTIDCFVAQIINDSSWINYYILASNLSGFIDNNVFNSDVGIYLDSYENFYDTYSYLNKNGIEIISFWGFNEYLEGNRTFSLIMKVLDFLILIIGTMIIANLMNLLIKDRLKWISMVKALGMPTIKIALVYFGVMQFILFGALILGTILTNAINLRLVSLAKLVLEYEMMIPLEVLSVLVIYLVIVFLSTIVALVFFKQIDRKASYELLQVGD
ncbi:MAG: hypothetical protein RBQ97_02280 [Acholeplasma sp.]|nr:hypothetical protein [Acholeplasma sp.]